MFLKSLAMKGFKSFADPTVLEFEPGITVVVGPNGSGKSNVVDAVTWVLGAQGPRVLRSQRMEDVIFAGTSSRPALGRAEVSLTIDNSSGRLPVDLAEVTITRTLFRSGDSEYAINGTPCRLLDIQELLSDSGVGRSQHMIVGQGQLDTVLNARPEDRRGVIEEAAGVLKHRRRRERAERRLATTAENLERLGDLVRELRRQIRPLERQAAAARSHASLSAELRQVRIHVSGSEMTELVARRQAATEGLASLAAEEQQLARSLGDLDVAATTTTAELASGREEDLAAALAQVQALVERARGTTNVLRERKRTLAGALDAAADVDVVSTLEAEGARLAGELSATEAEEVDLRRGRDALESAEERLAGDERAHEERWGDADALGEPVAALNDAERQLDLRRRLLEQERRGVRGWDDRVAALASRAASLEAAEERLAARSAELEALSASLAQAVAAGESRHREARAQAQAAEAEARTADQERHRSAARAEALARALSELEGAGGREALSGVDGVVGALVDLVEIDAGWEAAFDAAAGAALSAVVVTGKEAAREALDLLHRQGATGALLSTAAGRAQPVTGLPPGADLVRPHVRARRGGVLAGDQGIDAVLDALVGGAVRVGSWEAALDLALDRPDLVVVTAGGDRFARSGWRVRSGKAAVTAAAVEEAEHVARAAAERADATASRSAAARRAVEEAGSAAVLAARELDRHESARTSSASELARTLEERARLASELDEARRGRDDAALAAESAEGTIASLESELPALRAAAEGASERAAQVEASRAELDRRRGVLAQERHALEVDAASLAERRRVLAERYAEVERRLAGHGEEREAAAARRRQLEADGVTLTRLEAIVDRERTRLEATLAALRSDYSHQVARVRAGAARMEEIRRERVAVERRQAEVRERARTLDRESAEVALRVERLTETVEIELSSSTEEAWATPAPELPEGVTAAQHAADLASRLGSLGPVNPLALDELSALEERHRELDVQMADVRSARRQLQEVVRTLDQEIVELFAAAAADVNEHFSSLVAMLFPGGTGRLSLTEPEDLLNTGVEIEVRPAGRNVRRVSLLSGGERSLAALAFLFAVFRSRPSPFYLMDEVEAALDDVNLNRFLGLVREFRREAQLIVVSHQKRTMETGDALYGVTMAPGGSSQVVSQKATRRPEDQPVG